MPARQGPMQPQQPQQPRQPGAPQDLSGVTTRDGQTGIVGRGGNLQTLGPAALRRLQAGAPGQPAPGGVDDMSRTAAMPGAAPMMAGGGPPDIQQAIAAMKMQLGGAGGQQPQPQVSGMVAPGLSTAMRRETGGPYLGGAAFPGGGVGMEKPMPGAPGFSRMTGGPLLGGGPAGVPGPGMEKPLFGGGDMVGVDPAQGPINPYLMLLRQRMAGGPQSGRPDFNVASAY